MVQSIVIRYKGGLGTRAIRRLTSIQIVIEPNGLEFENFSSVFTKVIRPSWNPLKNTVLNLKRKWSMFGISPPGTNWSKNPELLSLSVTTVMRDGRWRKSEFERIPWEVLHRHQLCDDANDQVSYIDHQVDKGRGYSVQGYALV